MRKVYLILLLAMLACIGCEWQLKPADDKSAADALVIERYDRIEAMYLTTGDRAALQQMNTVYPIQTRTLIEDVLRLGKVNDPGINAKFLHFYQDSILQMLVNDVEKQYDNTDDLAKELSAAFARLRRLLPDIVVPQVYTQIGSFDQSIIVGHQTLGISLDKYLGADYPFYIENYYPAQRRQMVRSMIVPDCIGFYVLSLYPLPNHSDSLPTDRQTHIGKIQWIVNNAMGKRVFRNFYVAAVDRYMKQHRGTTADQLLRTPVLQ